MIALGGALLTAWYMAYLTPTALFICGTGLLLAWRTPSLPKPWRALSRGLLLLWAIALMLHVIPGVHNLKVLDQVLASPTSTPFNLYLNLDKPLIFFGLLLAWPTLLGGGGHVRWRALTLLSLPLTMLLLLAWLCGAIKPDIGLPDWWWLFILNNLLLTCVAEEALFRGVIQQEITIRRGPWYGIVSASVLFGIAHVTGGPLLMLFAALAGACYGLAFQVSGRLSVAILFHAAFNLAHLTFFTYPLASH
jgi:membrane protease YdiL (CAAX protease family)